MNSEFAALKRRFKELEERARRLAGKPVEEEPMAEADAGPDDVAAFAAMQGDEGES